MRQPTDRDKNRNITTHNHFKSHKLKVLTINVHGLNNLRKRNKIFNFLKTKKIDITLMKETHSTKITEGQSVAKRMGWTVFLEI